MSHVPGTVPRTGLLEPVLQLREGGPAGVELLVLVDVRIDVQVAPADGAEARAVGTAEDLVRELEDERVSRPVGEIELILREIRRPELVGVGTRRLVLTRCDLG